ncbi:hypothetical protein A0H76_432 [Hepatospora eriocheir]|uniref:Uncharacterized protein n=1 Tax=Hepatospora eriocheir TaxID=1081669 RepID=A0A1X0QIQ5_9MICR|nr:hypothetical protein A0H76_432 [Hepatospora eriocheir]
MCTDINDQDVDEIIETKRILKKRKPKEVNDYTTKQDLKVNKNKRDKNLKCSKIDQRIEKSTEMSNNKNEDKTDVIDKKEIEHIKKEIINIKQEINKKLDKPVNNYKTEKPNNTQNTSNSGFNNDQQSQSSLYLKSQEKPTIYKIDPNKEVKENERFKLKLKKDFKIDKRFVDNPTKKSIKVVDDKGKIRNVEYNLENLKPISVYYDFKLPNSSEKYRFFNKNSPNTYDEDIKTEKVSHKNMLIDNYQTHHLHTKPQKHNFNFTGDRIYLIQN